MLRPIDTATRERKPLSGLWRFALDPEAAGRRERWRERPLPGVREAPVPGSYNDLFADIAVRDHVGDAWYQTTVRVPARWGGEWIVLRLDSATHRAVVWLDETRVAEHEGGYTPFEADVTDAVKLGAENRITVVVRREGRERALSRRRLRAGTSAPSCATRVVIDETAAMRGAVEHRQRARVQYAGGRAYFEPLAAEARRLDPTRPVGFVNVMLARSTRTSARTCSTSSCSTATTAGTPTAATSPAPSASSRPSCARGRSGTPSRSIVTDTAPTPSPGCTVRSRPRGRRSTRPSCWRCHTGSSTASSTAARRASSPATGARKARRSTCAWRWRGRAS